MDRKSRLRLVCFYHICAFVNLYFKTSQYELMTYYFNGLERASFDRHFKSTGVKVFLNFALYLEITMIVTNCDYQIGCQKRHLRTFAPIATAHPYSARKFTCHVMHRTRALSTKMNNERGNGHCYSFAWI